MVQHDECPSNTVDAWNQDGVATHILVLTYNGVAKITLIHSRAFLFAGCDEPLLHMCRTLCFGLS